MELVVQLHAQALLLSQHQSSMPATGSVKTVSCCGMSQSLPHTSLASPLSSCMSLGKLQSFLPRVTNSPNPNQQNPRSSCLPQIGEANKAKAAFKAAPDTLPGTSGLCRLRGTPSITQQNRVSMPSREEDQGGEGTTFLVPSPHKNISKSLWTRIS